MLTARPPILVSALLALGVGYPHRPTPKRTMEAGSST